MPKKTPRREASASDTGSESAAADLASTTASVADSNDSAAEAVSDATAKVVGAATADPHDDPQTSDDNVPNESNEMEGSDSEAGEEAPPPRSGSLLDDVQAFFDQREELAQRLAEEIEATQEKLAELQETLAQLHPDRSVNAAKERRPKKVKKPAARNTGDAAEVKPSA
ncbi:hypothetical protein Poly24_55280 [Rosistilla carotiformis]|uniref:Uncharacterized protein n=1 Tax=Rosistilla carotiformis TaxID=2528017 RepID=A0A518K1U5_9BACT|nr:hypothetical protein [Rosistilla carotiformis]QDV71788.1 hypothetical protein Poly24_55280 [Rosistilla carotiformis]